MSLLLHLLGLDPAYGDYPFLLERKTVHLHPASEPWRDGAETRAGISKTREIKVLVGSSTVNSCTDSIF